MRKLCFNGRDCLCLFATKSISAGEELRYSYMDKQDDSGELYWRRVCTVCYSIIYLNVCMYRFCECYQFHSIYPNVIDMASYSSLLFKLLNSYYNNVLYSS